MQIKTKKLKHHPLNEEIYRLSNVDDLIRSIDEMGLLQPLVINQRNEVISGHRRLEAINKLGWEQVEVEIVETSDHEEETKLLIHHNKQRVKGVKEILNEVKHLMPIYSVGSGKRTDLLTCVRPNTGSKTRDKVAEAVGISSGQLARLLLIEKEHPEFLDLIENDEITVNQAYMTINRWNRQKDTEKSRLKSSTEAYPSNFIFHHKSSIDMTEIEDQSVDLIFTSPPYWNLRNYDTNKGLGNEQSPTEYVSNLVSHLKDCQRVIKTTGSFFLVIGDTFHEKNLQNIPHRVCIALQDEGWKLRNTIIWRKTNPKPSSAKDRASSTYEFIFHLVSSDDYKYHQLKVPYASEPKTSKNGPRHKNLNSNGPLKISPYIPTEDGKNITDYWDENVIETAVARASGNDSDLEHPAPFPNEVVSLPLLMSTDEGDVVLDPFMGSGTTGKVANQLNRNFIGYDIKVYH